jgi:hypothetical protein
MKTTKSFLLAASFVLAMAFIHSCSSGSGCTEPDKNGRIIIGGGITYQRCMEAAKDNKRCVSGGIYNSETGSCHCRAEACEE